MMIITGNNDVEFCGRTRESLTQNLKKILKRQTSYSLAVLHLLKMRVAESMQLLIDKAQEASEVPCYL